MFERRGAVLATIATVIMALSAVGGLGVASAVLSPSHGGTSDAYAANPAGASAAAPAVASQLGTSSQLASHGRPFGPSSPAVIAALSHLPSANQPGSWVYGLIHPSTSIRPLTSLPNLDLLEHPVAHVSNVITPGYLAQPAPLGLADFGLGANPYAYNAPHVLGAVTFLTPPNATDPGSTGVIEPGGQSLGYVGSVDEFGIQLNTILTNVSLQGNTLGVFWTQNVVNWNDTGIHFVSDTFNFTNGFAYIPPGTLVSACNNNTSGAQNILNVYGGVFQCVGGTIPLSPASYPVTIQLYNNASVNGFGQDVLTYGYYVDEAGLSETFTGVSDQLVFNDTGDSPAAAPPAFSVNGFTPTPLGLPEDSEIDLVGDIGGDNAVFSALNASISLEYSNASVGGFQTVPSAYNFGTDTGETSTGIADYWTPAHLLMANQGPAMLYGLWNAVPSVSVASGHIHVAGTITPSYGFVFVSNTPPVTDPFANGSLPDNFSVLPTTSTGAFSTDLPPTGGAWTGQYYVQAFAPGSAEVNGTPITGNAAGYTLTLPSDPGSLNAPLYMFSAAEASALAFNVSGSASAPYTFQNLTISPNASFNHLNDYQFPSFEIFTASGVGSVHVKNLTEGQDSPLGNLYFWDGGFSPSVLVGVPAILGPYPGYTSQLNLYFGAGDRASDESLEGFGGQGGEIVLWGDSHAQVLDVTASDGSGGVYVGDSVGTTVHTVDAFSGAAGVQDIGSVGTSVVGIYAALGAYGAEVFSSLDDSFSWVNVTWASDGIFAGEDIALEADTTPYYNLPGVAGMDVFQLNASDVSLGAAISVSSDVTLVNVSSSGGAAVEFEGVTGASVSYLRSVGDVFGLVLYASNTSTVTGSEFLQDGVAVLVVQSNDNTVAGNIFFHSGGPAVEILVGEGNHVYDNAFLYNFFTGVLYIPGSSQAIGAAGNYFNSSAGVGNYWSDWHTYSSGHLAPYPVLGGTADQHPLGTAPGLVSVVTFTESGLAAQTLGKHAWSVYFDGIGQSVHTPAMNFTFPLGTYPALVAGPNGWVGSPSLSNVNTRYPSTSVAVSFAKGKTVTLTFKEKGLGAGQSFCLDLDSVPFCSSGSVLKVAGLAPGTYVYEVTSPLVNQTITAKVGKTVVGGASGSLTATKSERIVLDFAYYLPVLFNESGVPNGTNWSVTIRGQTESAPAPDVIWFNLTNGSYHYTARATAKGYHAHPSGGQVVVNGPYEDVYVVFSAKGAATPAFAPALLPARGRPTIAARLG